MPGVDAAAADARPRRRARGLALLAAVTTLAACGSGSGAAPPAGSRAVVVRGPQGTRLAGREMGHGAVGVALAHGASTTMASWYAAMDGLAHAGYRVVAFDARGVGDSTGALSTEPAERARDIEAVLRFLRHQGARKLVVMGSSLGAYAAILVAERGGVAAVVGVSPATVPDGLDGVNVPAFFVASKGDRGPAGNARLLGRRLGRPPRVVGGSIHGADLFADHPEAVRALVAFLTRVAPAHS